MKRNYKTWLEEIKDKRSSSTYKTYCSRITKLLACKSWNWNDISSSNIQRVFDELIEKYNSNTVHNIYDTANSLFKWCLKNKYITYNPLLDVELPLKQKHKPVIIDSQQMKKLLRTTKQEDLYIPILIALKTGMRRSEILGLKWSDINFDEGVIYVYRSVINTKRRKYTLGKSLNREIAPLDGLIDILESKYENLLMKYSKEELMDMYVCSLDKNQGIEPTWFDKKWKMLINKIADDIGISKDLRFHDLRHSFITQQASCMDLKQLSKLVGHSSVLYTVDYYVA